MLFFTTELFSLGVKLLHLAVISGFIQKPEIQYGSASKTGFFTFQILVILPYLIYFVSNSHEINFGWNHITLRPFPVDTKQERGKGLTYCYCARSGPFGPVRLILEKEVRCEGWGKRTSLRRKKKKRKEDNEKEYYLACRPAEGWPKAKRGRRPLLKTWEHLALPMAY